MLNDFTNGQIKQYPSLLMHVDGGCEPRNPGGTACSAWVIYADKKIIAQEHKVVQKGGEKATNNFAEYCALGLGLRWLDDQKWRGELHIKGDSKLLVEQVHRRWQCKAKNLIPLRERIFQLLACLELTLFDPELVTFTCHSCNHVGGIDTIIETGKDQLCPKCHTRNWMANNPESGNCRLEWVPREQNSYADELTNIAYRESR